MNISKVTSCFRMCRVRLPYKKWASSLHIRHLCTSKSCTGWTRCTYFQWTLVLRQKITQLAFIHDDTFNTFMDNTCLINVDLYFVSKLQWWHFKKYVSSDTLCEITWSLQLLLSIVWKLQMLHRYISTFFCELKDSDQLKVHGLYEKPIRCILTFFV